MNAPQPVMSPNQTKDALIRVLAATRTRQDAYSFRLVQAQLRAAKMPSAQGWEPLIAKYEAMPHDLKWMSEWLDAARAIFWNAITVGRRAVVVFDVTEQQLAILADRAAALVDTTLPFAQSFPFPVEEEVLRASGYNSRFVAAVPSPAGDTWLFACGKRSYRSREPIAIDELGDDLSDGARDRLSVFEEVIGIRCGVVQAYDAVVIRHDKRKVEIHIDLCCPMSDADIGQAYSYYTRVLNHDVIESDDPALRLAQPHNFFPDIQRLYNTADGIVSSLGHATGTKSIKQERMRSRVLDLREELFHKEGMREIGGSDAFSIRKGWNAEHKDSIPTVIIPGHFSLVDLPGARVDYAIVENCLNYIDFEYVMGHVE